MDIAINYVAVVVAAIASMAIGFVWYGPLFGKSWIALSGVTPDKMEEMKKKGMTKTYIIGLVMSFLTAFVLASNAVVWEKYMGFSGVTAAFNLAVWPWLGFVLPLLAGSVLWEGKPWKLYFLNIGYYLVAFLVISLILVYWR
jgi:hypothetical protein